MAYCPICKGNYQIVTSTKGSSYPVPIATERYNSKGDYIGYETGETYNVNIETLPCCSNCYSAFHFPYATTKEEYDRLKEAYDRLKEKRFIEEKRKNKIDSYAVKLGALISVSVWIFTISILLLQGYNIINLILAPLGFIEYIVFSIADFQSKMVSHEELRQCAVFFIVGWVLPVILFALSFIVGNSYAQNKYNRHIE